jgi:hypothetical protein
MANAHAPEAPPTPIPAATELLARFSDAEPNDPDRPGGTLSDLLDELGDAFVAYGQAFIASSAMLRRHQPGLSVEAADLDAAGGGLTQSGWACRQLAPNLRGFLPALPWLPEDADIPPRPRGDEPTESPQTEPEPDGETDPPSDGGNSDASTGGSGDDDARAEPREGGSA